MRHGQIDAPELLRQRLEDHLSISSPALVAANGNCRFERGCCVVDNSEPAPYTIVRMKATQRPLPLHAWSCPRLVQSRAALRLSPRQLHAATV